jgi:hypothetical protein
MLSLRRPSILTERLSGLKNLGIARPAAASRFIGPARERGRSKDANAASEESFHTEPGQPIREQNADQRGNQDYAQNAVWDAGIHSGKLLPGGRRPLVLSHDLVN